METPFIDLIIGEFDPAGQILHLTAREKLVVKTKPELNKLCAAVRSVIERHSRNQRIYMVVDLSKFVIEPYLSKEYAHKIKMIYADYLHHNGLLRYGFQITRVTIQMGHANYINEDPNLFRTKEEALAHIDQMKAQMETPSVPD